MKNMKNFCFTTHRCSTIAFGVIMLMICITGCAKAQNQRHGGAAPDKSGDSALLELKQTVIPQFKQFIYQDTVTGKQMEYSLYIPKDYKEGHSFPLVMFIADASCASKGVLRPLEQGYGGLIWASESDQQRHPCFVLVPSYTAKAVDDDWSTTDEVEMTIRLLKSIVSKYGIDENRLYTTGQSMGGMMSMYYNIVHPDLFAASIFVGCQWDTSKMGGFGTKKFFYIIAGGDEKAPKGMAALAEVLKENKAKFNSASWSAKLPVDIQDDSVNTLLGKGSNINFIVFTKGSVLPNNGKGNEHMNSFDYAYKLTAVRDWLFKQTK